MDISTARDHVNRMGITVVLVAACLGGLTATDARAATASFDSVEIREILRRRVDVEHRAVGIVVGVLSPEGSRFVAYGSAGAGKSRPLDGASVFEIGSITKPLTAVLLADAVRRGEVRLDTPVREVLGGPVRDSGRAIRLEDLATHRSGLPRMPDNVQTTKGRPDWAGYDRARMRAFLESWRPERAVGERREYSNLGFGILGEVLAIRAGTSYETLLDTRLTRPLAMASTAITSTPDMRRREVSGHLADGQPAEPVALKALAGAGAVRSTAADLLRFAAAVLGRGPATIVASMDSTRTFRSLFGTDTTRTSLGWGEESIIGGRRIVGHDGGTDGFSSYLAIDVEARTAVVVLANTHGDVEDIALHVLVPEYPVAIRHQRVSLAREELDRMIGTYEISPGEFRRVARYGDRLFHQRTGRPVMEIHPDSRTTCFNDEAHVRFAFEFGDSGVARSITVLQADGSRATAPRTVLDDAEAPVLVVDVDTSRVEGLEGRYAFPGGARLVVERRAGRVMARLEDQAALEVFPRSDDLWFYLAVEAQLRFERDAAGRASRVILVQNGAEQVAMRVP